MNSFKRNKTSIVSVGYNVSSNSTNTTFNDVNLTKLDPRKSLFKRFAAYPGSGLFLTALSCVLSEFSSVCCKILQNKVSSNQFIIGRAVLELLLYTIIAFWRQNSLLGVKGERLFLFLRSFIGFIGLTSLYKAIQLMGLSDATSISFSSPVFCVIFAFFLLKEPFKYIYFTTLLMVISGIFMITKPDMFLDSSKFDYVEKEKDHLTGSILSLITSFCTAICYIIMRKLQKTSIEVSIIWFSVVSIIFGIGLNALFFDFDLPDDQFSWFIYTVGVVTALLGLLLLTISLKISDAGPVSLMKTLQIVISFLYQTTILHKNIEIYSVIGALLICIGVILSSTSDSIYMKIRNMFISKSKTKIDELIA